MIFIWVSSRHNINISPFAHILWGHFNLDVRLQNGFDFLYLYVLYCSVMAVFWQLPPLCYFPAVYSQWYVRAPISNRLWGRFFFDPRSLPFFYFYCVFYYFFGTLCNTCYFALLYCGILKFVSCHSTCNVVLTPF